MFIYLFIYLFCFQWQDLYISFLRLDDGINDNAVITFETICNLQSYNITTEDQFTIEITVQVKDTPEILANGLNDSFGIGVIYSNTQIWVGSYYFEVLPAVSVFSSRKHIYVISIPLNPTFIQ